MAERKVGTVVEWRNLSNILAIFQFIPQEGSKFPKYKAGQYIALRREDCNLTKKVGVDEHGHAVFGPDLDENGVQKRGPVTHSYSVASAPYETEETDRLEFYVILERGEHGEAGRLTGSMFKIHPPEDSKIVYVDRITGDFTLDKRAAGFRNVIFVGTGTGLAPFVGMIKQLHHEAQQGLVDRNTRYTLLHTNRTFSELGYHQQLLDIQHLQLFDFLYVSTVSRPTPRDLDDPDVGMGRANNVLRHIFEMPLREEEALAEVKAEGGDVAALSQALERAVRPVLPHAVSRNEIRVRMTAGDSVILCCGNPASMADIQFIARTNNIHFEKEEW